jgi:hypothetical protein
MMAFMAMSAVVSCQALTSAYRCQNKVKNSNKNTKVVLTKDQRDLLALLKVKESSAETALSMLPYISRAFVLNSHIYPLLCGGFTSNTILSTSAFCGWFYLTSGSESTKS